MVKQLEMAMYQAVENQDRRALMLVASQIREALARAGRSAFSNTETRRPLLAVRDACEAWMSESEAW